MFPAPHPGIHCLLQTTDAHPGLAVGIAPAGLLSPAEQARCDGFKVPKRRRDWLLGRWTAKHLLQIYLAESEGEAVPLDRIEILADEEGAPYARVDERLPLSLSISHSGPVSFCAVCEVGIGQVGADVEQVEPREMSFVRTFFTPAENAAVDASAADRDILITSLWSAKEAVLKTLHLGLRADTREVEVDVPALTAYWTPVSVHIDPLLLRVTPSRVSAWIEVGPTLVLSLALLQ